MTTKHTPTPWHQGTLLTEQDRVVIFDDSFLNRHLFVSSNGGTPIEEAEANAAFIVKAANCHDELVKQLEDMTFKFQRLESVASAFLTVDQMQEFKKCWSASIATLAKAGAA